MRTICSDHKIKCLSLSPASLHQLKTGTIMCSSGLLGKLSSHKFHSDNPSPKQQPLNPTASENPMNCPLTVNPPLEEAVIWGQRKALYSNHFPLTVKILRELRMLGKEPPGVFNRPQEIQPPTLLPILLQTSDTQANNINIT